MRLIHTRTRHPRRGRTPRISISQDEITADLNHRGPADARRDATAVERGRR